jgi:hypothetical protein
MRKKVAQDEIGAASLAKAATGPRTSEGKNRSKYNAVKHGIFSKVLLVKDESKGEFDPLLDGLADHFRPDGTLEEILVEKLATLFWRYRRLLIAERAQVQNEPEKSAPSRLSGNKGLIQNIGDPPILEQCKDLLFKLRRSICETGLNQVSDLEILREIYGDRGIEADPNGLFARFSQLHNISSAAFSDEERKSFGFTDRDDFIIAALQEIDAEILNLGSYIRQYAAPVKVRDSAAADRLNRYEASLERAIDRTLNQIERVQRLRKGQIVPPPIKLELSS